MGRGTTLNTGGRSRVADETLAELCEREPGGVPSQKLHGASLGEAGSWLQTGNCVTCYTDEEPMFLDEDEDALVLRASGCFQTPGWGWGERRGRGVQN